MKKTIKAIQDTLNNKYVLALFLTILIIEMFVIFIALVFFNPIFLALPTSLFIGVVIYKEILDCIDKNKEG